MYRDENKESLAFRDLPAEAVYHMAHTENDLRDMAAEMFKRLAFVEKSARKQVTDQINKSLANQNERDYEWLADQAELNGLSPQIPIDDDPAMWLRIHFSRTAISNREVARQLGISEEQMSAITKGRRECAEDFKPKLQKIFAHTPMDSLSSLS